MSLTDETLSPSGRGVYMSMSDETLSHLSEAFRQDCKMKFFVSQVMHFI